MWVVVGLLLVSDESEAGTITDPQKRVSYALNSQISEKVAPN